MGYVFVRCYEVAFVHGVGHFSCPFLSHNVTTPRTGACPVRCGSTLFRLTG